MSLTKDIYIYIQQYQQEQINNILQINNYE